RGRTLRLAAEPGLERRVPGEVGPQDLDGDTAPEAQVPTLVDLGHPASADDLAELVAVAEAALLRQRILRSAASALLASYRDDRSGRSEGRRTVPRAYAPRRVIVTAPPP